MVLPSAVLFNGGVFKAGELRRRILESSPTGRAGRVPELESSDLDLAVAHGAAYYGQVSAAGACGFGAACRGRITSVSKRPRRRSRALRRRSRPCASCRWAWRKEPRPTSPAPRSA